MTSQSSGLTMLTSGVSQYLHPDYLQPLPTTLDAKKSPLALLAQTCSAIGKDTSPSKPIIPPLERKDVDKMDKESDSMMNKRPGSHGAKDSGRDSKPGFRTFPPKEIPPLVPISSGEKTMRSSSGAEPKSSMSPSGGSVGMNLSMSSSSNSNSSRPVSAGGHHSVSGQRSSSRSSNGKSDMQDHHHHHRHSGEAHHHSSSHKNRDSPASSISSAHPSPSSPSFSKAVSSHSSSVMQSSSLSSSSKLPPSSSASSHPSLLGGMPTAAHLAGYPGHLALMTHGLDPASSSYHSALAAHSSLSSFTAAAAAQSSALKAAAAAGNPSALSPFVTYARVRTPSGATTLVPVCRDPYCTNCQLTLQNSHLSSTCNAPGCSQCAHEKSLTSLSALGLPGAGSPSMLLPSLSTASSMSALHSLYPHSALAAAAVAAHQGLPYVCNWVSSNDYCGKRFSSSDELLQHLRTHTSSMDLSALAASYAGIGLPSLAAAYPHLSAPLSPNSLRRSYPTSLSPVSSLLGANRYHPYKSPLSAVGAAPQAPQSYPVGAYYPPYLYGQRLGAAVVP